MTDWFTDTFGREFDKQAGLIGRYNLGVFGKTGVGKSTLVNAVFGEDVAATGIGAPVTQDSSIHVGRRGTLGIVDTRGLEIGRDDAQIIKDVTKMITDMRKKPLSEQVHAVWYCVNGMGRRFEDAEAEFIRTLDRLGLPVVLVLTQVPMIEGRYHPDAVALARHIDTLGLPIVEGHSFFTFAMRDQFTGQPPHGLVELLQATFRHSPDAVHAALAAAQTIDLRAKSREAQRVIGAATTAAVAAAASPIPFSDAALLVPIQMTMFARLAHLYQLRFDRAAMLAIASTSAATTGGRAAFTNLIKLIPGAGTVVGGAISAGVASAFTLAMGQAWLVVCQRSAGGGLPSLDGITDSAAVKRIFEAELRSRLPGVRQPGT